MANLSAIKLSKGYGESWYHQAHNGLRHSSTRGVLWIPGLCTGLAIACSAALVYGHAHIDLNGTQFYGLTRCDVLPCFRGMVPSQTSWAEVTTMLKTDPILRLYSSEGEYVLLPSLDGHSLGLISITPAPDHVLLAGEIIALYGVPDCLEISRSTGTFVLRYSLLDVNISTGNYGFDPGTPVSSIIFWGPASTYDDRSQLCSANRTDLAWLEGQFIVRA